MSVFSFPVMFAIVFIISISTILFLDMLPAIKATIKYIKSHCIMNIIGSIFMCVLLVTLSVCLFGGFFLLMMFFLSGGIVASYIFIGGAALVIVSTGLIAHSIISNTIDDIKDTLSFVKRVHNINHNSTVNC